MAAAKAVAVIRGHSTVPVIPPSLPVPLSSSASTLTTVPTSSSSSSDSMAVEEASTEVSSTTLASTTASLTSSLPVIPPSSSSSTALSSSSSSIYGIVRFQQAINQTDTVTTRIQGRITGLQPHRKYGLRIVIYGDESDSNFRAMGGIYNPYSRPHSDRLDDDRAIGALGNIETNYEGIAVFDFSDSFVKLIGPLSVLGRSIVITQNEDDGGKGNHPDSLIDGNSGPIIAAGVIGISAIPIL